MNKSGNEFECNAFGFYFIELCSTHVSDFMVPFRRLIMARVFFFYLFCFQSENCFDKVVILFNSRICVCE